MESLEKWAAKSDLLYQEMWTKGLIKALFGMDPLVPPRGVGQCSQSPEHVKPAQRAAGQGGVTRMKIAISGKMQAGKTTCSDYLEDSYGFAPFSFAAELKHALVEHLGVHARDVYHNKPPLVRQLMQVYGQVMREQDPAYWIDKCLDTVRTCDDEFVVIDDMRFRNEAEALRDLGWTLVRLEREGWPPYLSEGSTDESEVDLDDFDEWDYVITAREGDIQTLWSAMDMIVEEVQRETD